MSRVPKPGLPLGPTEKEHVHSSVLRWGLDGGLCPRTLEAGAGKTCQEGLSVEDKPGMASRGALDVGGCRKRPEPAAG